MIQKTKLGKGGHGQEAIDEQGRYTDETPADKLYQAISAESKNISKPIANSSPSTAKLKPGASLNDLLAKLQNKKKYNEAIWFKEETALGDSFAHFAPKLSKLWKTLFTLGEKKACIQHTREPIANGLLRRHKGDLSSDDFSPKAREHIENFTRAIQKSPLEEDTWLQRGIDTAGAIIFTGMIDVIKKTFGVDVDMSSMSGSANYHDLKKHPNKMQKICDYYNQEKPEIYDDGFYSCGTSKNSGFAGGAFIFNTFCPKGTKGIYVDPVSAFGENKGVDWDGKISEETIKNKRKSSSFLREDETVLQRGTHFRIMKMEYDKAKDKFYIDLEVIKQLEEK